MNAETLIKALKCCTSLETGCIDCPNIDLVTGRCSTGLDTIAIDVIESLQAQLAEKETTVIAERETLQQWVNDLQSGMYVNCVYCGHRYGPAETTPVSMADALKEHIENCPKHPMSVLKAQLAESQRRERAAVEDLELVCTVGESCFVCKNLENRGDDFPCIYGEWCMGEKWQWRGPATGK